MAEGFAKKYFAPKWAVESAGIEAHGLNPKAVEVMAEIGIDISHQRSKRVDELGDFKPDVVVTLCGDANENCPLYPGSVKRLHWDLPDPAKAKGNDEEVAAVFRSVRDEIERLVRELADNSKGT
jgi:arsenate reductase